MLVVSALQVHVSGKMKPDMGVSTAHTATSHAAKRAVLLPTVLSMPLPCLCLVFYLLSLPFPTTQSLAHQKCMILYTILHA